MSDKIEDQIREFIAANILFSEEGFPYDDEASFLENSLINSTSVLEIVMFIEDTFSISIADSEVVPENFDSISKLASFVRRKLESQEK